MQRRVWEIVEVAKPGDRASYLFDSLILTLITLNVVGIVVSSVEAFHDQYAPWLHRFEYFSVAVFSAEYFLRLWSCKADPRFQGRYGRLRLVTQPLVFIDLVAILPFFISLFAADLVFMRTLRLLRLLRVAKLARYLSALKTFGHVWTARREELVLVFAVMALLLVLASCGMYFVENPVQPDVFPDIPSTMWWAIATLTTVGYGDAVPVTGAGKLLASVVALIGLALFAMPAGIMGSAFVEIVQNREKPSCPHCGLKPDEEPVVPAPAIPHTEVTRPVDMPNLSEVSELETVRRD